MNLVVDASVAAKWFIDESLHQEALELLDHPEELYSLDLVVAEVTNIAWKKVLRGEIEQSHATEMAKGIRQGIPLLYPTSMFNERALELALLLQHPVYDCLYLACTEAIEGILVTANQKFRHKAQDAGFENLVHYLGSKPISVMMSK